MPRKPEIRAVLVLEPDSVQNTVFVRVAETAFPGAQVYGKTEPSAAAELLAEGEIGLLVVALRGFDVDIVTLLGAWADHNADQTRVLIVTSASTSVALAAVQSLPIAGVFDSSQGDLRELEFAFRAVAAGSSYWSRSVREAMRKTTAVAKSGKPSSSPAAKSTKRYRSLADRQSGSPSVGRSRLPKRKR